jgi:translation initiation factor 2B subunit (eIF-2B alpha/beta/delta family)
MAANLSKIQSIGVTLIPDSNIYCAMSRVNKVLMSPLAIMSDGECICAAGHKMVAVAAKVTH